MKNFKDYGLKQELIEAVENLGYEQPTEIQELVIPQIINQKNDLIALAQTGTGKTAAFGLPLLQMINPADKHIQALVLSPTRELAMQIGKDLQAYAAFMKNIRVSVVYGGSPIEKQILRLKDKPQICVGTPGRTLDLIKRKKLNIRNISFLVLDEADEMLNMGFRDELDAILETAAEDKQTLLFSATMPDGVRKISKKYLKNPVEIVAGTKNTGAKDVHHVFYIVPKKQKYEALKRIVDYEPDIYSIVFCRTRSDAKEVAEKLTADGYNADALHGDMSQAQRDFVMRKFRNKNLNILVATDVAARGIDIAGLTHIINYNIPEDNEAYIHRSGRTGRAGQKGISIIIAEPSQREKIYQLQKITGKKFERGILPSGREICNRRVIDFLNKLKNTEVDEKAIKPFADFISNEMNDFSKEELLKKLVTLELNSFIDFYSKKQDIKEVDFKNKKEDKRKRRERNIPMSRLYINLGSKQHLKPVVLLSLINEALDSNNVEVGKIDIQRNISFFEIEKKAKKRLIERLSGEYFGSKKIVVDKAVRRKFSD